ncbi:hypothetical protein [Allohahella sp. A8]|uniref:hypothetical protein n=1 Tax=Allohahella sp. A8 TaxID=3141461 RepID=UPI003A806B47
MTNRYLIGLAGCLVIVGASYIALNRVEGQPKISDLDLAIWVYVQFFLSTAFIYVFSIVLWRFFARQFGIRKDLGIAFIDMGLFAVGKYFPGKIWGIFARGACDGADKITITRTNVLVSTAEQIYCLGVGVLVGTALALISLPDIGGALASIVVISVLALCVLMQRLGVWILDISNKFRLPATFISMTNRLILANGYIGLWLLTSLPLIILIGSSHTLNLSEAAALMAAFTCAMIAGWIAVFAPGGIGIREASFVLLAPAWLTWQEAVFWITLHRMLFTLFDLCFGVITVGIATFRYRLSLSS